MKHQTTQEITEIIIVIRPVPLFFFKNRVFQPKPTSPLIKITDYQSIRSQTSVVPFVRSLEHGSPAAPSGHLGPNPAADIQRIGVPRPPINQFRAAPLAVRQVAQWPQDNLLGDPGDKAPVNRPKLAREEMIYDVVTNGLDQGSNRPGITGGPQFRDVRGRVILVFAPAKPRACRHKLTTGSRPRAPNTEGRARTRGVRLSGADVVETAGQRPFGEMEAHFHGILHIEKIAHRLAVPRNRADDF